MSLKDIPKEKIEALLNEGFSLEFLESIMQFKPSPFNPNYDHNTEKRMLLGLDRVVNRACVSMSNHDIRVVATREDLPKINPIGN